MIDDAGDQEEPGLVQRVRQQQGHGRGEGGVRAKAHEQHHRAQGPDRGVGQHQLEVVLPEREDVADEHRQATTDDEHHRPQLGAAEHGCEPRHEVDAGGDHGGRMQVGADRRRRGHRIGQPEVERELGRLGQRTEQDEEGQQPVVGARLHRLPCPQHLGDGEAPAREAQQHQPGDHGQLAADGHDERLLGGQSRGRDGVLEADEQVRGHAGQAPEDEHQQEVVGQHQAQHRGHEGERERVEAVDLGMSVEVVLGVEDDRHADARDEQAEEQRQAIERERQRQLQLGHPLHRPADRITVDDARRQAREEQRQASR